MKIRANTPLGLAHFTLLEVPPHDLVSLAARTGFSFIGLRLHPAFSGAPYYELPPGSSTLREMCLRLKGEGIRVHDIEFVTISSDFVPANLTPILETAGQLGARRISVCGDDPDRSRLIANIAELCDLAARFDMSVDLECMAWRRVASLPDAVRVMLATGRANAGVLVDALHLSRTGGSPGDVRDVPVRLIKSAQLCDASAAIPASQEAIIQEARSRRLPPGEGELPLGDLLACLPEDTALALEVPMENAGPPEQRALRLYKATKLVFERDILP